ncbi:hypothetical protein [Phocaeicola sp.]
MMKQKGNPIDLIGTDIRNKIKELGRLWRASESSLKVPMAVLDSWEQLVSDWATDTSMPLIIRKGSARGQEFEHPSGRKIIISDNTFALWVYRNVLDRKTFTVSEIKDMLDNDDIPMVYALKKEEKEIAKHTKTLGKFSLSDADSKWKLCHIEPVGLNSRKHIEDLEIERIIEHFKKYANPKNMFALPKEIGGLGEVQEFINEQKFNSY